MKKITLLGSLFISLFSQAQTFTDNFDSYTAGSYLGTQSAGAWTTWNNAPGTATDVLVSNADALSGANSLHFVSNVSGGGPTDVIRNFGVLNTGQFSMSFQMKVGTGKAAYFNLQKTATPGDAFTLSANFGDNGELKINEDINFLATYPQGSWFEFRLEANLNLNQWEIFFDNVSQGTFTTIENQVASIDLYPVDQDTPFLSDFFIDDFSTTITPYTLPAINAGIEYVNITGANVAGNSVPSTFKVRNLGVGTITSFDVVSNYNGINISQSFTGLTLASLAEQVFTMTNNHTLVTGTNVMTATISNVNTLGADGDAGDNVETISLTPQILPAVNGSIISSDINGGSIVGLTSSPTFVFKNLGVATVTGFDIAATYNGTTINQTFSGLTLAVFAEQTFTMTNTITLVAGAHDLVVTVSNVNSLGVDGDATDNVGTISITPIVAATGKMVVTEEGTGTWCGFCVRGAVFMGRMATKYPNHWAGVAVHNGDPMTDVTYDTGMGALISGYPTALVDRGAGIDPADMEASILARLQIAPKALITNGATWDATTRTLNVSVTANFTASATNSYKLACVLTEDGVHGTEAGYIQSNYYSGGGYGPMGGFELLADHVPAADMIYDHVGRAIKPSFAGSNAAFPSSIASGAAHTMTFSFVLPATWDETKMEIVGMLIDGTGKIDNAGKATIAEAVTNGFVAGIENLESSDLSQFDDVFQIYPNPATTTATVSIQLQKESTVELRIVDMSGKEVGSRNYGTMNGASSVNVNTSNLEMGVYLVELTVNNQIMTKRLIVR